MKPEARSLVYLGMEAWLDRDYVVNVIMFSSWTKTQVYVCEGGKSGLSSDALTSKPLLD